MGAGTAGTEDSESDSKKEEFGVRDCMCVVSKCKSDMEEIHSLLQGNSCHS